MTTNGAAAPAPTDGVDYRMLAGDLAMQVGNLTAEVMAQVQLVNRLRSEVAHLRQELADASERAGKIPSPAQ